MVGYRTSRLSSRRSFLIGAAVFPVAAAGFVLPARSSGLIYPGVSIHGLSVEGLSRAEAESLLRSAVAPLEKHAVRFVFDDRHWDANLADLGMSIDVSAMLDDAFAHGRSGNPVARYAALTNQGRPEHIPLKIVTNELVLTRYLEAIGNQISIEPVNAQLARRGTTVEIVSERIGRTLDLDATRADTQTAVATGAPSTVYVRTSDVLPNLYGSQLEAARDGAAVLITDPITFMYGDLTYPIDPNDLAGALAIAPDGSATIDLDKLDRRIQEIAGDAQVAPVNARIGWDAGPYVVADDIDGRAVDIDEFGKRILATSQSETDRTAELPVVPVRAGARTDNIDELGLTSHLAYGLSLFTGSNDTRAANIIAAANNISYRLVGPGETFSFNRQMGPIAVENGFVEGKIIQGDWTASDLGGGVCQVSTTVFRAAFYAGFRFSEWNHHGWRLLYYEADGSPPGLDAAIYQPNSSYEPEKDLKFINALDSWLLLMMVIDGESVVAHLYGRPNGWEVEVGEARISDPIKPGDPVYRENPQLTPGQRQQVKAAQDGYDVSIRRTVSDADGEIVSDGDFTSNYRAQPEIWEVGPGTPGVTITLADSN